MPVSLAQAKLNTQDDVDVVVIDEFRKESWLLDNMIFDDVVNPAGGGATLTYGYTRLITQPTADFRAINSEYTPTEVTKARYTTDLKVLGGSYQIDRVLGNLGPAASNEEALQSSQKIKAARTKFHDAVINGDNGVDANSFDGLSKALAGSSTEIFVSGTGSDFGGVTTREQGIQAVKWLRRLYAKLDGTPSAFLMNEDALAAIETIAEITSALGEMSAFGQTVRTWRGIPLIDLGEKAGSSDFVIGSRDPDNSSFTLSHSDGTDGGTFRLTVEVEGQTDTTDDLAWNISTGNLDTALEALDNVPSGAVTVTGSAGVNYAITFAGGLAGKDVRISVVDDELLDTPVLEATTLAETGNTGGLTDIYAVRLGLDGFHGLSTVGGQLVKNFPIDWSTPGAVKTGEVEMGPVGVALKATKAAAVLRNVKVA